MCPTTVALADRSDHVSSLGPVREDLECHRGHAAESRNRLDVGSMYDGEKGAHLLCIGGSLLL